MQRASVSSTFIDLRAQPEVTSARKSDTPTQVVERIGGRCSYLQSRPPDWARLPLGRAGRTGGGATGPAPGGLRNGSDREPLLVFAGPRRLAQFAQFAELDAARPPGGNPANCANTVKAPGRPCHGRVTDTDEAFPASAWWPIRPGPTGSGRHPALSFRTASRARASVAKGLASVPGLSSLPVVATTKSAQTAGSATSRFAESSKERSESVSLMSVQPPLVEAVV